MDHLRVLKEHEDEIKKIRQELEIQMQRYKINKLIELEKCERRLWDYWTMFILGKNSVIKPSFRSHQVLFVKDRGVETQLII